VLDVVFHDDLARLRTGSGPQNMAIIKHMAMNMIRNADDKHSLRVRPGTFLSFAKFSDHEAYGSQTHETEC
jgi:hypothetical protein